jgi:hypothetical protein
MPASASLVVNPFASVRGPFDIDGESVLDVLAPKTGAFLQHHRVSQREEKALFAALARTSRGEPYDEPLEPRVRARLREIGVLVAEHRIPVWPRFRCGLRLGTQSGFALGCSPRGSKLWTAVSAGIAGVQFHGPAQTLVEDAVTRLRFPYWCGRGRVRDLRAVRPDSLLLRALRRDGLRVSPADLAGARRAWERTVERRRGQLASSKFVTVAGAVPLAHLSSMSRYYRRILDEGFADYVPRERRFVLHNDPIGRIYHRALLPLIERLAGEPLKASYSYFSAYPRGTALPKHTDREQCEYTASLLIDFEPRKGAELPWPIGLDLERAEEKRALSVKQQVGDVLLFRGRELAHFRRPLRVARRTLHLFMHYVRHDFVGSLD